MPVGVCGGQNVMPGGDWVERRGDERGYIVVVVLRNSNPMGVAIWCLCVFVCVVKGGERMGRKGQW